MIAQVRALLRKHELTAFFVLVFICTWLRRTTCGDAVGPGVEWGEALLAYWLTVIVSVALAGGVVAVAGPRRLVRQSLS